MARAYHVRPTYVADDGVGHSAATVATRIVNLIGGVIMSVLALRFLLSLFGANRGNVIADFIYDVSHPFVAPFFGLFNYTPQFGAARFEFETLIAIVFYAIATMLIVGLLHLGRRVDDY